MSLSPSAALASSNMMNQYNLTIRDRVSYNTKINFQRFFKSKLCLVPLPTKERKSAKKNDSHLGFQHEKKNNKKKP